MSSLDFAPTASHLELRARLEAAWARVPRRALHIAGALLAAALVATIVLRSRSLLAPLHELTQPHPGWLAVALAAELAALVAYAAVVRRLLAVGGVRARLHSLLRPTVGGIALGASLPGGQAASGVYWYKQLRREGADGPLAALAMVGTMLAGMLSLVGILVAGVAAADGTGPLGGARLPILAGVGALVLAALLFRSWTARAGRALVRRLAPALPDRIAVRRRDLGAIAVFAFGNWLLDCICLYVSLRAVGAEVPLQSILLTFALAAFVATVPLLPGGGGTVEATLLLGFAAFGHTSASVVAGILLFRVVSCWGLVPVGWLVIAVDGRRVARGTARCEARDVADGVEPTSSRALAAGRSPREVCRSGRGATSRYTGLRRRGLQRVDMHRIGCPGTTQRRSRPGRLALPDPAYVRPMSRDRPARRIDSRCV